MIEWQIVTPVLIDRDINIVIAADNPTTYPFSFSTSTYSECEIIPTLNVGNNDTSDDVDEVQLKCTVVMSDNK